MPIPACAPRQPFAGRLLLLGFGCIGNGVLPLLLRHLDLDPGRILVVAPEDSGFDAARALGVPYLPLALTPANFEPVLREHLRAGDFLLNLSVDVSSIALVAWCQRAGVLYLDTCIEPWAGHHVDAALAPQERSNHALRRDALALRARRPDGPTAVLTHGANPGLVSHFAKQALLDLARDAGLAGRPASRDDWARLAQALGVRAIHVAERDTQYAERRKAAGEFANTWSVDAFVGESCQPAELGWGTHERHFPPDGVRPDGGRAPGILLQRPGASVQVRSWTPLGGPLHGWLVTHAESLSLADWLTVGPVEAPVYRPTVHYAYRPCDDAVLSLHEFAESGWAEPRRKRVLKDEIAGGVDELGVLLLGHRRGAYWYGSQLSIGQARTACPCNSATSLQVAAAVTAGLVWAIRHPSRGIVEPEELPHDEILALCRPYLGDVVGVYSDWTPLAGRGRLFAEDCDRDDPWQFRNVRIV